MMIQVWDAVIICWWGAASPAQWECVSVIRQTICAGPEAEKKDSSRLVHLSIFWWQSQAFSFRFFSFFSCQWNIAKHVLSLRWTTLWSLSQFWPYGRNHCADILKRTVLIYQYQHPLVESKFTQVLKNKFVYFLLFHFKQTSIPLS